MFFYSTVMLCHVFIEQILCPTYWMTCTIFGNNSSPVTYRFITLSPPCSTAQYLHEIYGNFALFICLAKFSKQKVVKVKVLQTYNISNRQCEKNFFWFQLCTVGAHNKYSVSVVFPQISNTQKKFQFFFFYSLDSSISYT